MKRVLYQEDFKYPESGVDYHCYYAEYPILHDHDYWEVTVIWDGKIRHNINGKESVLSKNDLIFIRPKDRHCFFSYKSFETKQFNFMITDEFFQSLCSVLGNTLYNDILYYNKPIQCFLNDVQMKEMISTVENLQRLNVNDIETRTILIKLVFVEVIKIIYNYFIFNKPEYPEWLNSFMNNITKPENFNLKIDELYALTNFSRSHLNRLFKKYTGTTIIDYVKKAKFSYAANLLEFTNYTILDIASRAGYDSFSCFHKYFKLFFNMTPSEYRKKVKQK